MTPTAQALSLADRVLGKHYRSPQAPQGFVDLGPELRAGIVDEVLPLFEEIRRLKTAPDTGIDVGKGGGASD